ncbi:dGTP triphosphohydrolase [Demequina sp.]|uniref:dGTP triphosphohydrolase n=1 Tax=Demequina sp. TaxID=2050685 RepID=UPI003D138682
MAHGEQQQSSSDKYARRSGIPADPDDTDTRTATERDVARLHYAPALRRLAGVTQVVSPDPLRSQRHTRESHSHKVALLAREIGVHFERRALKDRDVGHIVDALGGLDVAACEAAALAHDLGHPPFGHAGEEALNRLLRLVELPDGFQGNAQTFRIVTRLATHKPGTQEYGLDLTAVTLAAIQKYPRGCPPSRQAGQSKRATKALHKSPKFGYYVDDRDAFEFAMTRRGIPVKTESGKCPMRSLEADVMDIADDFAYAIHDLEDFHREGIIDFSSVCDDLAAAAKRIRESALDEDKHTNAFLHWGTIFAKEYPAYFDADMYANALGVVLDRFSEDEFRSRHDGSPATQAFATGQLSWLLGQLYEALSISQTPPKRMSHIYLERPGWHLLQVLKTVTRRYVVSTVQMGVIQQIQSVMMEVVFRGFERWLKSAGDLDSLPHPLSDWIRDGGERLKSTVKGERHSLLQAHYRAISDFICTMSDEECVRWSQRFAGAAYPGLSDTV